MNTFGIANGFQNSIGEIYQKDWTQVAPVVKNLPTNAGDTRDSASIPGWEDDWCRKRHPLQYSCLENSIGRGIWQVTVHGVAKSWT